MAALDAAPFIGDELAEIDRLAAQAGVEVPAAPAGTGVV